MKLTAAGKRYLKNPTSFMIVADKEFKDDYVESAHEGSNNGEALDPTLFCHVERPTQECGEGAVTRVWK